MANKPRSSMLTDEQFFEAIKAECAKAQETPNPIVVVWRLPDGTFDRQRMLDGNYIEDELLIKLKGDEHGK